tara:strand:+ start:2043 stop:3182 length:1140 start_codon:yes stop_codon:yes gene_type:complete
MSIKILATGDFQLDKRFGTLGNHAKNHREQLMKTFEEVITTNAAGHDLVLIAGDLFDRMATPVRIIEQAADILSRCPSTCVVLPGNHDPVISGIPKALIEALRNRNATHVHVILKREPLKIDGLNVTLYPAPLFRKDDISDLYGWMPPREETDGIRVALMHGALDTLPNGQIPDDLAERMDLDIVVCGDQHGPSLGNPEDSPLFNLETSQNRRLYYAMAPEAQHINQNFVGAVLSLTMSKTGAIVSANRTDVGKIRFFNQTMNLDQDEETEPVDSISTFFEPLGENNPQLTSIRLKITGELGFEQKITVDTVLGNLQQQWPLLEVVDKIEVEMNTLEPVAPEGPLQRGILEAMDSHAGVNNELKQRVTELLPILIGRCN